MAKNITREQLIGLLARLARSAYEWNMAAEDDDKGPGNNPIILLIHDDGSGLFASSTYPGLYGSAYKDVFNVQNAFGSVEEAADYLIEHYDALEGPEE